MRPFFTIIIPTHNRPLPLTACLRALAALHTPRTDFEVILVDDGSTPPLDETRLASWRDTLDLTIVRQSPAGPAAARNHGARLARGTWLAFTDDDCQPVSTWLNTLATAATGSPTHALGGRTINALPDNRCATASQLVVDHLLATNAGFLSSNNLAVPAAQFHAMGGFDPTFRAAGGEDRAFCDDWRAAGHRLVYLPAAVVWHAHALNLRSFWRQHLAYGRGAFRYRARPAGSVRRMEPAAFYAGLVAAPLTQRMPYPTSLTCLLLLAQVATAAGFVHAALIEACTRMSSGHIAGIRRKSR